MKKEEGSSQRETAAAAAGGCLSAGWRVGCVHLGGYIKHNEHTHIKFICVEGSENLICGFQTATFCNKISDLR
jgi:hypothetical protein